MPGVVSGGGSRSGSVGGSPPPNDAPGLNNSTARRAKICHPKKSFARPIINTIIVVNDRVTPRASVGGGVRLRYRYGYPPAPDPRYYVINNTNNTIVVFY